MPSLKWDAGAYFQYLLNMIVLQQCTSFLFKCCAAMTKDGTTAHAVGGLSILILCIYSGFFIPAGQMHHWEDGSDISILSTMHLNLLLPQNSTEDKCCVLN